LSDATFSIDGDEMQILSDDDTPINETSYEKAFLTEFYLIFNSHTHLLCLQRLRQQKIWKKEIAARRAAEQ